MRNIGLVSAAVIAMSMAAMAGTVAASAPPVMQNRVCTVGSGGQEQWLVNEQEGARYVIDSAVASAQGQGLSGEAAQQHIKQFLQGDYIEELRACQDVFPNEGGLPMQVLGFLALSRAQRSLINDNQLRSGSDGDLGVSALLAEREAESREGPRRGPGRTRLGGLIGAGPSGRPYPREQPVAAQGSPTAGDAARNVPGNAAAGQPATDAGTTGIRRSRATYDSDLDDGYDPDIDDEAGEPD